MNEKDRKPQNGSMEYQGAPLREINGRNTKLLDPVLLQREEDNLNYMMHLENRFLLLNFNLEAGRDTFSDMPEGIHKGWEFPTCQLRGHFLGQLAQVSDVDHTAGQQNQGNHGEDKHAGILSGQSQRQQHQPGGNHRHGGAPAAVVAQHAHHVGRAGLPPCASPQAPGRRCKDLFQLRR